MARRVFQHLRSANFRSINLQPTRVVSSVRHPAIRRGRPALFAAATAPVIVAAAAAPAIVAPAAGLVLPVRQFRSSPMEDLDGSDLSDDEANLKFRSKTLHPIMNAGKPGRNRQCVKEFNKWKKSHVATKKSFLYLLEKCRSRKPFAAMSLSEMGDSYLAIGLTTDFAKQFPDDRDQIQKILKAYRDFFMYLSNIQPLKGILELAKEYEVDVTDNQKGKGGKKAK